MEFKVTTEAGGRAETIFLEANTLREVLMWVADAVAIPPNATSVIVKPKTAGGR